MKTVNVILGYYPIGVVTGKQISFIQGLLEREYGDETNHHYITKYDARNPFKRENRANAKKLIVGLLKKIKSYLWIAFKQKNILYYYGKK